ncbi:MAG: nuclear transport factor 2 family protein [Longimicrobiaceae bacterium]
MRKLLPVLALLLAFPAALRAQSAADSAAVRRAALDYIEGWYGGDAARMQRAVHPELAKRIVHRDAQGQSLLSATSADALVYATRLGAGKDVPPERQEKDVRILTLDGDMASVRLVSTKLVDYMHLARWNGEWKIVNVLWDFRPGFRPRP